MTLSQPHTEYLRARGVTDTAVIEARGYRTIGDSNELRSLGFSEEQSKHVPGLLLPVYNTVGEAAGYEYRADNPRRNSSGKPVKFDRPAGQQPAINVNPHVLRGVRDHAQPFILVEGVTRADALAQRGVAAAAVMGVYGLKGKENGAQGAAVLSELHEIPLRGRDAWFFPDGDATSKPGVNSGARMTGEALQRRGAKVRIGIVPDEQGLDDWLANGGNTLALGSLLVSLDDLPVVQAPKKHRDDLATRDELPATTDRDLAQAWLKQSSDVCYLPSSDSWVAYMDGRWQEDANGAVARVSLSQMLADTAAGYLRAADGKDELAIAKVVERELKSTSKMMNVQRSASALRESHARDSDFDRDPWLFNCSNGTLNLRTATLRDHDASDKMRAIAPAAWDAEAEAPHFLRFLEEVLPDADTRTYVQQILGCALVGTPLLHLLPVFVGSGRNGKGTLVHALGDCVGTDYSGPVDKSLLISSKFESHPTKLMALKGKRLVTASETDAGDKFAAASLKMLTGGDAISARGMRQDQQQFDASHSMLLLTNNLPEVDALDEALWARLKLIKFSASFVGREDSTLRGKLAAEASGVLRWLVEGLQAYLSNGYKLCDEPLGVAFATGDWRMSENSFLGFANERLIKDPKGAVTSGDLIAAYSEWCRSVDAEPLRARALGAAVKAWGAAEKRTSTSRGWKGCRLREASDGFVGRDDGSGDASSEIRHQDQMPSDQRKPTTTTTTDDTMTHLFTVSATSEKTATAPAETSVEPKKPENTSHASDPSSQPADLQEQGDSSCDAIRHPLTQQSPTRHPSAEEQKMPCID